MMIIGSPIALSFLVNGLTSVSQSHATLGNCSEGPIPREMSMKKRRIFPQKCGECPTAGRHNEG